jgi:hypothetical protein
MHVVGFKVAVHDPPVVTVLHGREQLVHERAQRLGRHPLIAFMDLSHVLAQVAVA